MNHLTINAVLTDVRVEFRPASFLGNEFKSYLTATRAAGLLYDAAAKCQHGAVDQVMEAVESLGLAGFEVEVDQALKDALEQIESQDTSNPDDKALAIAKYLAKRDLHLRSYQVHGIRWFLDKLAKRNAALLHDDMGTGKTMMSLLSLARNAPVLVVCPASIKGVWKRETNTWRPDLSPVILSGRGSFRWPTPGEVVITNYDILSDDPGSPVDGTYVIFDEVHKDKNWKAKRTVRSTALANAAKDNAGYALGLTGTPILNTPPELWSILSVLGLAKAAYGSYKGFCRAFNGYKGKYGMEWGSPNPEAAIGLKRVALGRRKSEVLGELPPKQYQMIEVEIDGRATKAMDNFQAVLDDLGLDADTVERESIPFDEISKARAEAARCKIPSLKDMVEIYEESDEPIVVFSHHREPVEEMGTREGWATITGSTSNEERTRIVEAFQAGNLKGVAGTSAMSEGLTLTRASTMIFVDRPWTPALGAQTEDRIHRIGQTNNVQIIDLVLDHTIDQMVYRLLCEKKNLIDGTVEMATGDATIIRAADLQVGVCEPQEARPKQEQPELPKKDFDKLFSLFDIAEQHLKYPKFRLVTADGTHFVLALAGERSRYRGAIHVSDGAKFDDNVYHGRINRDGTYTVKDQTIIDIVLAFQEDPEAVAKAYGLEFSRCCFCAKELTHKNSLNAGYGPICAGRYGLPWGGQ